MTRLIRPADVIRSYAERGLLAGLTGVDLVVLWDAADRAASKGYSYESAAKLAKRYGWHYWTVRRSARRIAETGVCRVVTDAREGRTSVWDFSDSIAELVHNPALIGAGYSGADPAPIGRVPRADESRPRADGRDVTYRTSLNPAAASADVCELCDGTLFISVEVVEGDRSVWASSPCACHPKRQAR